jgi:sarcosine oxidase
MAMRALDSWRDLQERAGETLLVQTGGLDFGPGVDECAEAMTECGLPGEWLPARDAEERFPVFSLKDVDRVLWHEQTGICLADRAVAAQVRLAREAGVDVREETPMTGIRPSGDGVVVETESGAIEASVVVVAGGGWNTWILDAALRAFADGGAPLPIDVSPRMIPTVQDVSYFRPRDPAAEWPVLIEWLEHMWYAAPGADGPGIKVGRHMAGRAVNPSDGPFETLDEFQRDCEAYVRARCPGLEPEPIEAETCLYTMTADEDFVLDRVGPIVVGGGCSGHGFKFGPLIGEILADLATDRDAGLPGDRFSAVRPALARAFPV